MCLEETAYQRNILVQGKNEEKKTFHKLFFRGAPAFFKFTCRSTEMVFTLSHRKHHRKENIVIVSAYILKWKHFP